MASVLDVEGARICRRLQIEDWRYVEIESKWRVLPEDVEDVKKYLLRKKGVHSVKTTFFFDQFLDTPGMDLFRLGGSLRLRFKKGGSSVYLQYKGPGFHKNGLLYRSEFSTERLRHLLMEESHHDIIRFSDTSVQELLNDHAGPAMSRAMTAHLGARVVSRISAGPILSMYQKEKFMVELGTAFLEPSLDRIFAFHITGRGPYPLSTFWEYENEIKSPDGDLQDKLDRLPKLTKFDAELSREFDLKPERLDKYHRCASFFLRRGR